jgi:hypothetical protein
VIDCNEYGLAAQLLAVLGAEVGVTRGGADDLIQMVHPGGQPPMYGCGLMWTRVVGTAADSGAGALQRPVRDGVVPTWRVELEMGVYRCYPVPEGRDVMPEPVVLDSAARDAFDDAAAMRRAAVAAFLDEDGDPDLSVTPMAWRPVSPMGGVHGGLMTVRVMADLSGQGPDDGWPMLPGDPRA